MDHSLNGRLAPAAQLPLGLSGLHLCRATTSPAHKTGMFKCGMNVMVHLQGFSRSPYPEAYNDSNRRISLQSLIIPKCSKKEILYKTNILQKKAGQKFLTSNSSPDSYSQTDVRKELLLKRLLEQTKYLCPHTHSTHPCLHHSRRVRWCVWSCR